MLAIVLLFASSQLAIARTNQFYIDTDKRYCGGPWWARSCNYRVDHSGSGCTIYAKNGWGSPTESKTGPSNGVSAWSISFNSHTSISSDTWLWTSCSDALLIDRATLYDQNNQKTWGMDNGDAWCLSTDKYDNHGWEGYSGHGHCFRTLLFSANGKAYYYPSDFWWTPDGRRALEGENVPTLEDVQDCEHDEDRDQKECEDLVDLIFKFDMEHKEALVELSPDTEDNPVIDSESDEITTDDRRVLRALKKILEA